MAVPNPTIREFLQNLLTNYPVSDELVDLALASQGIDGDLPAFQFDPVTGVEPEEWVKKRELASAFIYLAASGFVNGGGSRKQLGNRSWTEMTITISAADREYFRNRARYLYLKWGIVIEPDDLEISDGTFMWGSEGNYGHGHGCY